MSDSEAAAPEAAPVGSVQTKSAAKKEAKRQEKLDKLAAKSPKTIRTIPSAAGVSKKKLLAAKSSKEEEVFVNITPKGAKKGTVLIL